MSCAVLYPIMPLKMDLIEKMYSPVKSLGRKMKRPCDQDIKTQDTKQIVIPEQTSVKETHPPEVYGARPKYEKPEGSESKCREEKKKKWKSVPLSDLGFNLSLFPRPTRPERIDPEEEKKILERIERDLEDYDNTVEKYIDFDVTHDEPFEGKTVYRDKLVRRNKDRRIRKAHKQVKDKYCTSVKNNLGRKKLFIHHRLFKLINLEEKRLDLHLPSRSKYNGSNITRSAVNKSNTETKSRLKPITPAPVCRKPAPVQNLRFALQRNNAASCLESDLVNVLINLQHRDLTPEDYETLLRLDDSVAPKTIDKSILDNLKTDIVSNVTAGDICSVCMEPYEVGQKRKFLPCAHVFHCKCIDMWLENSSRNCPIDGLPIDEKL